MEMRLVVSVVVSSLQFEDISFSGSGAMVVYTPAAERGLNLTKYLLLPSMHLLKNPLI